VGEQAVVEEELRPPAKAFVKSRRQRQQEEEAAAGQDRFKLINGKEVAACVASTALACGLEFGRPD
jgi:GTP-binding protein HflX